MIFEIVGFSTLSFDLPSENIFQQLLSSNQTCKQIQGLIAVIGLALLHFSCYICILPLFPVQKYKLAFI